MTRLGSYCTSAFRDNDINLYHLDLLSFPESHKRTMIGFAFVVRSIFESVIPFHSMSISG